MKRENAQDHEDSRGIGRALALEFHRKGRRVYAIDAAVAVVRDEAGQAGAVPAEAFAVPVVEKLLLAPPPRIIRGGTNSVRLPLLKKLLPARILDAKLSKLFGLDALR